MTKNRRKAAGSHQRQNKAGPLRYHRCQCHTLDRHAQAEDEQDIQGKVGNVDKDDLNQNKPHMLAAEQAAEKHHVGKGRGDRQQPDSDILLHQRLDRRAGRQ